MQLQKMQKLQIFAEVWKNLKNLQKLQILAKLQNVEMISTKAF